MKKYVQTFIVIVALVILAVLTVWLTPQTASADLFGNNIGPFFDTYSYKAAVIKLTASQSILVEVRSWRDYDDSDTITLTDTNGMNYYIRTRFINLFRKERESASGIAARLNKNVTQHRGRSRNGNNS